MLDINNYPIPNSPGNYPPKTIKGHAEKKKYAVD
jgi:hypothetical protein